MKKILDCFPEKFEIRKIQQDVLSEIENSTEKFIILSAPTGSGKSVIARTLANTTDNPCQTFVDLVNSYEIYKQDATGCYVNADEVNQLPAFGSFTLTITKGLQNQYKTMFDDTELLKGKTNYQCAVDNDFDTEIAPCLCLPEMKRECQQTNKCPYFNHRNKTMISKYGVLNYSMFLNLPPHLRRRQIIICDEASELEDEIVKRFSATVPYKALDILKIDYQPLITEQNDKYQSWLIEITTKCTEVSDTLSKKSNKKELSDTDKNKLRLAMNLARQLSLVQQNWSVCDYVVEKDSKQVQFIPLKVDKLCQNIFDHADKIILMSATIIDPVNFAKTLGIDKYKYIEADSTFDSKKSPIYISADCKLNYKNLTENLPKICQKIETILKFHNDDKGIIHTHTMAIAEYIKNYFRKHNSIRKRLIVREAGIPNEFILKQHSESEEPTVLVSPSLTFGVDLKDDLSRFQIIVKLPYAPLNTKRVKTLFDENKQWYADKMLSAFVQACGRSTRSVEDFSNTYVLDGNIVDVFERNKEKLPKYFVNRFV